MNPFYIVYLGLLFITLLLSGYSYIVGVKKSVYLVLLLFSTLAVELFVTYKFNQNKHFAFGFIYHLFNPVEYTFFCLYYLRASNVSKFKTLVKYSIPVYITLSLCISFFIYHIDVMPGKNTLPAINIDIEGFILFIYYTHLLFTLNIDLKKHIYGHPDFWISIGVMIFYGGTFVFLGLYSFHFKINLNQTLKLFSAIDLPLNIILYSCINVGLIWSIPNRKYIIS